MALTLKELAKHCSEEVRDLNRDLFAFAAGANDVVAKRSKYGNTKVVLDGITFDSSKEARRYQELTIMLMGDEIASLKRQVTYELQPAIIDAQGNKQRPIRYTADFVYEREGKTYIEDVKSDATCKTESFRVRWRMLLAKFRHDPQVVCTIYNP